jgi:2-dehydropantoate 2-reductase
MPHLALIGPGAIGSTIAAHLYCDGEYEFLLCARRPLGSLTVQTLEREVRFSPAVATQPAAAKPVDWVLIATKAYDAASAMTWLPALCKPSTRVAILQNGVEHRERFAGAVPDAQLVPVMVDCPAERTATGVIQRGPARLVVQNDANGREFVELFRRTSISATTTPDLKSTLWRKLCVNAAGVISGLIDQPAGIMRHDAAADLGRAIIREVIAVGRAEGAVIDDDVIETVLAGYRSAPPDALNSLHADRRANRPSEIDARNGVIVRLGRKHGIATPYNEMALRLMTLIESTYPRT